MSSDAETRTTSKQEQRVLLFTIKIVNGDKMEFLNLFDDPVDAFDYILKNNLTFVLKYKIPEYYSTNINREALSMIISYKASWGSLFNSTIQFSVEKIEVETESILKTFIQLNRTIKSPIFENYIDKNYADELDLIYQNLETKKISPLDFAMDQSNNHLMKEGLPKLLEEERNNIIKNTNLLKQQLEIVLRKKFENTVEQEPIILSNDVEMKSEIQINEN